MAETTSPILYDWATFSQLSAAALYHLLQLRQQVFVVEQNCPYLDADGLDEHAWHLLGWQRTNTCTELVACLRIIIPGKKRQDPTIGRLATAPEVRGQGVGRELMTLALGHTARHFPHQPVRISAQLYLQKFYEKLGFIANSDPYDEDSILHIDMILPR